MAIGQKINRSGVAYLDGTFFLLDFTYSSGY
jgi:hypothetical protein